MLNGLALGLGMFSACWLIHVGAWRIRRPQGYLIWLPAIFLGLPLLAFVTLHVSGAMPPEWPARFEIWIPATALHLLLSAFYTCGYAGLTEYSPSAEILKVVHQQMPEGIAIDKLRVKAFTEHSLTGKRLEHLVLSGMITILDGRVWLTKAGRRSVALCRMYRKLTGVSEYGAG
jgi:hypothetical protein